MHENSDNYYSKDDEDFLNWLHANVDDLAFQDFVEEILFNNMIEELELESELDEADDLHEDIENWVEFSNREVR